MTVPMPSGADLGPARGTDFYDTAALLTDDERALRDRVRHWGDTEVIPVINDYWERGEVPWPLLEGFGTLGVAGGSLTGPGCADYPRWRKA